VLPADSLDVCQGFSTSPSHVLGDFLSRYVMCRSEESAIIVKESATIGHGGRSDGRCANQAFGVTSARKLKDSFWFSFEHIHRLELAGVARLRVLMYHLDSVSEYLPLRVWTDTTTEDHVNQTFPKTASILYAIDLAARKLPSMIYHFTHQKNDARYCFSIACVRRLAQTRQVQGRKVHFRVPARMFTSSFVAPQSVRPDEHTIFHCLHSTLEA
jgi:hypothetical protein